MTTHIETYQLTKNVIILYVDVPEDFHTWGDVERIETFVRRHDELYGEQFREAGFKTITLPNYINVVQHEQQEDRQVFYIDVGNIPASEAQSHIERIKDRYKSANEGEKAIFIPVRGE